MILGFCYLNLVLMSSDPAHLNFIRMPNSLKLIQDNKMSSIGYPQLLKESHLPLNCWPIITLPGSEVIKSHSNDRSKTNHD